MRANIGSWPRDDRPAWLPGDIVAGLAGVADILGVSAFDLEPHGVAGPNVANHSTVDEAVGATRAR
jgi:hypothetical protein